MNPIKIQQNFNIKTEKTDGENTIVTEELTCCNAHNFEVSIVGEVKQRLFSKPCVYPENNRIVFEVKCKKCGKVITVFDSVCDGYDNVAENPIKNPKPFKTNIFNCKKCSDSNFSVEIKYEYPNIQELKDLGIVDIDNAFTWVWITIRCNKCNKIFRNFIDFETA